MVKREKLRVYCVQTDITWEDRSANFERINKLVEIENPLPGSLLVLPELFAVGFSMDVATISDSAALETLQFLTAIAKKYAVFIYGGFVTIDDAGKGRNEAAIVSPAGEVIARYHKLQPFSGGEQLHYTAGMDVQLGELEEF